MTTPDAKQATPEPWSERRWKQLEELERLLIECESIDNANNTIARLKMLIASAERLGKWDRKGRRQSFVQFLREQARHGCKKK